MNYCISTLPHIGETRKIMIPETYDRDHYEAELRKAIAKVLSFLCHKIDTLTTREYSVTPEYIQLGANLEPQSDIREILQKIGAFLTA